MNAATLPMLLSLGAAAHAAVGFEPHHSILLTSASILDESYALHQEYDQTLGFTPWLSVMQSDEAFGGVRVDAHLRVETAWLDGRRFTGTIDAAAAVHATDVHGVRVAEAIAFASINAGFVVDAPTMVRIDVLNDWGAVGPHSPRVEVVFSRDDGLSVIADWTTADDDEPLSVIAELGSGLWHMGWSLEVGVLESRPGDGVTARNGRTAIDVRFIPSTGVLALAAPGVLAAFRRRR